MRRAACGAATLRRNQMVCFIIMEAVYQYMWKHGLVAKKLPAVDGRTIEIIYPGRHNTDAGPDFVGARLKIGGQEWAGNVEIHVKASDWHRHRHDTDPAYDNVILHVVGINDTLISDKNGDKLPQTVITFPETFIHLYSRLSENITDNPCGNRLKDLSPLTVTGWLESLSVERMQQKSQRILDTVKFVGGDWQRACFITLARALGFSLNSEPLEMLARSLSLSIAAKHSDNILQLEALLFGQAGMLDSSVNIFDEYYQSLCREYFFLARKYGLRPMRRDLWKFARTRPQNFPTRRIAVLAKALSGGFSLLSSIIDPVCNNETAEALFNWELDGYWSNHLDFDKPGVRLPATLSDTSRRLLAINLAAPILYAYGAWRGDAEMSERGLDIWHDADAENNSIVRKWAKDGIRCCSASDSQAVLQLQKEYCDRKRCLECRFGHALLRKACREE